MRTRPAAILALSLTVVPAVGSAQPSVSGMVDIGLRGVSVDGDEARLERYRDLSQGLILDSARFDRSGERSFLSFRTENTGRNDGRYWGEYLHGGKVKLSFLFDGIPQHYSYTTKTLYTEQSPGVLRVDDGIQKALQNSPAGLEAFAANGSMVSIRSIRRIAAVAFTYSANRETDLSLKVRTTGRVGMMPYSVTFGHSNAVELPAPIDTRTTDVTAGFEWANNRGSARVAYDASVFTNYVQTLIWDNPIQFDDISSKSSQGRAALAPNNTLHAVTATGSYRLPVRSRVTGSVTLGSWQQDEALLPFTINSALTSPALPRSTAQAEARTVAMNYTVSSRPWRMVWLNARYRYYEFDNRTPEFAYDTRVRYDSSTSGGGRTHPLSSSRHQFNVEAAVTPATFTSLRAGYARENVDRTHRIFETTAEDVFRASADTTLAGIVTLRGSVEHAERTGSGFDAEALEEVGEQPGMRHFDIANRTRNRLTGLAQVAVHPTLTLSTTASRGNDEYPDSEFGLQDSDTVSFSVGADWAPDDRFAAAVSFVRDGYDTLQRSRSSSGGDAFEDPRRDWTNDSEDRTKTVSASVDLIRLLTNTEVRVAYDLSSSRSTIVYGFPPDSTLGTFRQLAPLVSRLERATADVRYFLTEKVAIGGLYWFDEYKVEDFSLGPEALSSMQAGIGNNLFLTYALRPYRAHIGSVRFMYFW